MEKSIKPPTYEESLAASSTSINKEYDVETGTSKPPTAPPLEALPPERPPFVNFGVLTDKDLREACYEYITDECCYGSRFIKDMTLVDIYNGYSFRYKLQSFGEQRETKWTTTGYYGQIIDGPENGPPPLPWDIMVQVPTKFSNSRTNQEIPHTATVERCSTCSGDGRIRCAYCYGDGYNKCTRCDGSGRNSEDGSCRLCGGRGKKTCFSCNGVGRVKCSPCDGHGNLKRYKELIVTWTNHMDEFYSDSMKLPMELILEVNGRQVAKEEDTQVFPLTNIPDITMIQVSSELIIKHQTSFRDEKIIAQRQELWAVPLTRAKYSWKRWQDEFYVYGFKKKVYFQHYPQQCCGCTCC